MDDVRRLTAAGGAALNEAKTVLAQEVTTLIHGRGSGAAHEAAQQAFGGGVGATCAATVCRMRRLLAANSKRVLVY